jgi:hypothetical protein
LNTNCYDLDIDKKILEIVKKENVHFNLLQDFLNVPDKTISKHLRFLTDKKIIEWTRNSPGKKGSIKFTPTAKIQEKYYGFPTRIYIGKRGICEKWKEKIDKESNYERRLKMILFLLLAMSYGYRSYEIPSTPQKGMILLQDQDGKQFGISIRSPEEGFSPDDLDKKDYFSAFQDLLLWNRFTKEETKQIIDYFEEDENILIQRIPAENNQNEERYDLKDKVLKELLIWCGNVLKNIVVIIKEYWIILSKKPSSKEAQWFSFLVGNKRATEFFQKIDENRARKKTCEELYREYKLSSNYVLDPEDVENEIKEMKKKSNQIPLKKVMQEELFNKAFKNKHNSLNYSIKSIHNNEKIQKLIKEGKYLWILKDLKYLINWFSYSSILQSII